jgi:hypothetical protein
MRRPVEPVSICTPSMVWQLEVPGAQIFTDVKLCAGATFAGPAPTVTGNTLRPPSPPLLPQPISVASVTKLRSLTGCLPRPRAVAPASRLFPRGPARAPSLHCDVPGLHAQAMPAGGGLIRCGLILGKYGPSSRARSGWRGPRHETASTVPALDTYSLTTTPAGVEITSTGEAWVRDLASLAAKRALVSRLCGPPTIDENWLRRGGRLPVNVELAWYGRKFERYRPSAPDVCNAEQRLATQP